MASQKHINSEHTASGAIWRSYGSRAAIIVILTVGAFMYWQFPACFKDPADVFCVGPMRRRVGCARDPPYVAR